MGYRKSVFIITYWAILSLSNVGHHYALYISCYFNLKSEMITQLWLSFYPNFPHNFLFETPLRFTKLLSFLSIDSTVCLRIQNHSDFSKTKLSVTGNRTPVSRVTGGDTHHYTITDWLLWPWPLIDAATTIFVDVISWQKLCMSTTKVIIILSFILQLQIIIKVGARALMDTRCFVQYYIYIAKE